ncbi:hypothetical protein [Paenibacillus camelliae]|uniref:hypothetical protein n=1 Tax=Paenibacillus camelliae TaxID=512410 RepID=UPI00203B5E20|nr:hypothetical protein [Paenibacillus camelliae]MCM3634719.1 hypothetical protein [Paenibacillus camelliae]
MLGTKRRLNVILSFVLVFLLVAPTASANSFDLRSADSKLSGLKPVSTAAVKQIEQLETEIMKLNNEKLILEKKNEYISKNYATATNKKSLLDSSHARMSQIDAEMQSIDTQLAKLGVEKPSKELLLEFLKSNPEAFEDKLQLDYSTSSIYDEMEDIIDTWNYMYNVTGYATTYSGKTQYHLTFMYKGNDPYLSKNQTKTVYSQFSSGSTQATYWINEVLSIYVDKLIGASLKKFDLLPWELLFSSKPTNSISSTGDATVAHLQTLTTVKFVFVYNTSSEYWFFALSTNYVNVAYNVDAYIIRNNQIYNDGTDGNLTEYGDYNNSLSLANSAYNNGYADKRTLTKVKLKSKSMGNDQITINLHNPTFIAHMY